MCLSAYKVLRRLLASILTLRILFLWLSKIVILLCFNKRIDLDWTNYLKCTQKQHLQILTTFPTKRQCSFFFPLERQLGADTFQHAVHTSSLFKYNGAGAIVLECATRAKHRSAPESELSTIIIDPTQSAVKMAIGSIWENDTHMN